MKLRFAVDQAECFRQGIDCPKSITVIEVNPADLPLDARILIADHLHGIDVCVTTPASTQDQPVHIKATRPTLESLLSALGFHDLQLGDDENIHEAMKRSTHILSQLRKKLGED